MIKVVITAVLFIIIFTALMTFVVTPELMKLIKWVAQNIK